jgi:hypothetical protein
MGGVQGQAGEATRLGSKNSGLTVWAAGWGGRIEVKVWHDDESGRDLFEVREAQHVNGAGREKLLVSGVIGDWHEFNSLLAARSKET